MSKIKPKERTLKLNVSADNLLNQLRMLHYLKDSEEITNVIFKSSVKGYDIKGNPTLVVPITLTIQEAK